MDFAIYMYFVGLYMGVTLLLGTISRDEIEDWVHPRGVLLVPIMGLLIGAAPMLSFMVPVMIASKLGLLPGHSIMPACLVFWTVAMIGLRVNQYRRQRPRLD